MIRTAFNPAYVGTREDIVELVPMHAKFVLDVGCSSGNAGASIKARTGAKVYGIEISENMAAEAREKIDKVFVGAAETVFNGGLLAPYRFDVIIFADVLEHLVDPWAVLSTAVSYLQEQGTVVISIPNIRHVDTLFNLVFRGRWPYRDRGIHDRTHLRFFTRRNIVELLEGAGLHIDVLKANYRIIEKPHDWNRYAKIFALPGLREFLAFQYLARASKRGSSAH